MSAPAVDPSLLSSSLGILGTTPAWPTVEDALHAVESGGSRGSSGTDGDREVILDYADMLSERGDALGLSLYCSAIIAQAAGLGREMGLVTGLEAVAEAYRLVDPGADVDAFEEAILDVLEEAESRFELPEAGLPPTLTAASWEAWREWVDGRFDAASRVARADLDEASRSAWDTWKRRLDPWVGEFADQSPTFDELVCQATERDPATVLGFEPEAMTVEQWSRALLFCVRDAAPDQGRYAPLWLLVPASIRLTRMLPRRIDAAGLASAYGSFEIRDVSDEVEGVDDIERWIAELPDDASRAGGKSGPGATLIVRTSGGTQSVTREWRPQRGYPTLIYTASDAQEFLEAAEPFVRAGLLPLETLVVEEPSDESRVRDVIDRFSRLTEEGRIRAEPDLVLYPTEPDAPPRGVPFLAGPIESVDEVFERARREIDEPVPSILDVVVDGLRRLRRWLERRAERRPRPDPKDEGDAGV